MAESVIINSIMKLIFIQLEKDGTQANSGPPLGGTESENFMQFEQLLNRSCSHTSSTTSKVLATTSTGLFATILPNSPISHQSKQPEQSCSPEGLILQSQI